MLVRKKASGMPRVRTGTSSTATRQLTRTAATTPTRTTERSQGGRRRGGGGRPPQAPGRSGGHGGGRSQGIPGRLGAVCFFKKGLNGRWFASLPLLLCV